MNFFSGNPLDRNSQSHLRATPELLLKKRMENSQSIVFNGQKFLVEKGRGIKWLNQDILPLESIKDCLSCYLGHDNQSNVSYWGVDVASRSEIVQQVEKVGSFVDPRPAAFDLNDFESSVFAQAKAVLDWNQRYIYCPACGTRTESDDVGYKRKCGNKSCISHSTTQNYSHVRTDAVAIINVISPDGQKILLGRQKQWPPLRYSCIAGFLETGESLEEAASREVLEEAGVSVKDIKYHSSQPWPFPSQLMLGCHATATTTEINTSTRDKELEDAKWFDREQIRSALMGANANLKLPPSYAIAHTLIKDWAVGSKL